MGSPVTTYGPGFNQFAYDPAARAREVLRRRQELAAAAEAEAEAARQQEENDRLQRVAANPQLAEDARARRTYLGVPEPAPFPLPKPPSMVSVAAPTMAAATPAATVPISSPTAGPTAEALRAYEDISTSDPAHPVNQVNAEIASRTKSVLAERQHAADAAAAAENQRHTIRAIRLPGGKIVFSNLGGSYGSGVDVGMDEAIGTVRRGTAANVGAYNAAASTVAATPRGEFAPHYYPPTSADQEALLRMTSNAGRMAPVGVAGEVARGGVSQIEGTPEQQRRLRFDELQQAIALAGSEQELAVNEMSPLDRARLANPEVVNAQYLDERYGPALQRSQQKTALKLRMISDPNDREHYIPDERQRALRAREIEDEGAMEERTIMLLLSGIAGRGLYPRD